MTSPRYPQVSFGGGGRERGGGEREREREKREREREREKVDQVELVSLDILISKFSSIIQIIM